MNVANRPHAWRLGIVRRFHSAKRRLQESKSLPVRTERDTFEIMSSPSREKVGRNDRCPCGSGKKYKHCCLNAQTVSQDSAWRREREACDRLTDEMQRFVRREFSATMQEAWKDFNQTDLLIPFVDGDSEGQIFWPWLLFQWDPEGLLSRRGQKPRMGIVAESFLLKAGNRLSEMEEMILEQATTQPVTFYEVILSVPGERLVLRNILIGGDTEVLERKASTILRAGDLCYGQIWKFPALSTLGSLAPIRMPAGNKVEVIGLRAKLKKKIAKRNRDLDAQDLIRYADDIRGMYLDLRDALHRPPALCNTDGDPIVFHIMTYHVGSAQVAFDALAPLAWGLSKEELLEIAEVGDDGTFRGVEFDWAQDGNKQFETWENTILGHLKISGQTLTAETNSSNRAEALRGEIEQRLGLFAVHQNTSRETLEEMLKQKKQLPAASRAASSRRLTEPALDPELQKEFEAQMAREVERWITRKIPALGGRTPMEAVLDPDGREMVEALLLEWERKTQDPIGLGSFHPDIDGLRRVLKLLPPPA
ncbi:MAG TPA: SEC-C metal-binding domain-containing protein [Acidobacteriaceae bacterium]|jgi:hypothetical protein